MKIKVNDIEIAYDIYGQGDDIWLLLHGNRDNRSYLDPLAKAIAKKTNQKVYNLDMRGHGESGKPAYPYTLEMFENDLMEFIHKMGIKQFSVISYSLGATIIMSAYKKLVGYLKKLVFISASAHFVPKFRPPDLKNFSKFSIEDIHKKAKYFLFSERYLQVRDCVIAHWATIPASVHESLLGIKHPDLREDIKQIQIPTLLIYGEKDRSTTVKDGEYIHKCIPSSYLVVVPHCSHFVFLEEPKIVEDFIINFI